MEKKKKAKEEEKSNWFDFIFPKSDVLFKHVLSIFITYYVLTWLFEILQYFSGGWSQFVMSLTILWVVSSFVVYHLRQIDLNTIKKNFENIKWKNNHR